MACRIEKINNKELESLVARYGATGGLKMFLEDNYIKPGVSELFESNPELANAVYEALGYETSITQDNKSYYRGQIEKPTIDKNGNLVLHAKEDELYKKAGLKSKGVSMTDDLQSAIEYGIGQLDVSKNLASEENIGIDLERELDRLDENGYYLIQIPKNISNEIVKEAGEVKVIGDKIVIPKGQYKIEQVIDGVDTEITPEQKQQVLELYSQYLDSIGVTDIAYHHSEEDILKFTSSSERYFQNELKKKGKYIPKLDDIVFFVKKPLNEEFMSKRKFVGTWGLKIPNTLKFYAGNKIGNGVHPGIDEGVFAAIENNYDAVDFGRIRDNKTWSEVIAITNPNNAVKLGSKQDIENFANFVAYENSDFSKIGNINQFRDYIMSKNFAAIEEFLVVNNKIDRKC